MQPSGTQEISKHYSTAQLQRTDTHMSVASDAAPKQRHQQQHNKPSTCESPSELAEPFLATARQHQSLFLAAASVPPLRWPLFVQAPTFLIFCGPVSCAVPSYNLLPAFAAQHSFVYCTNAIHLMGKLVKMPSSSSIFCCNTVDMRWEHWSPPTKVRTGGNNEPAGLAAVKLQTAKVPISVDARAPPLQYYQVSPQSLR